MSTVGRRPVGLISDYHLSVLAQDRGHARTLWLAKIRSRVISTGASLIRSAVAIGGRLGLDRGSR